MRFSTLPFLLALIVGLAPMGLSVYDIHAREVGALDVGPWAGNRTALTQVTRTAAPSVLERLLLKFGDEKGEIAAELLVPIAGIKALTQRAADLVKAMAAEQAKLGDAKLTADQRDAARADFKKLEQLHTTNAEDLAAAKRLADLERNLAPVSNPDQDAANRAAAAARVAVTDRVAEDPKKGFKDHRDFMQAVLDAGQGRKIDQRLMPLRATQGSDEQGVYSDPHGGFLVPHGVAPGILQIEPEDDPIQGMVTPAPMRTPTVSFNARVDKDHTTSVSGGLIVTRHPETADAGSSRMKFEQVTMTANEEVGLAYATERIITDSPESFVAILAAGFRDEYAANRMKERLVGSGTGEPLGVIHANNSGLITVSKENGQGADTIQVENIDKMAARCWRYGRSVWLANHDTRTQLRGLVRVVGTGGAPVPYFTTNPNGQEFLDGRPIYFTEFCKKLGDKGDLVLGVWSEYLFGEYRPLQSDESIHVRFAALERCFRFYRRNDGQPWWKAALTPANSPDTLGPFVTLAAR